MQHYTVYFWKSAINVSGGISTRHQEHAQLYLQYLVFVKPLLLPAAIVEELERSSNSTIIAPDDEWRYHPKHVQHISRKK